MNDETSAKDELSATEFLRYSRQLMLPELGEEGQLQLKRARVLVVGAGGLGSAACLSLAAAGVGYLEIADPDAVELSNLQRQLAFQADDVGINKAKAIAGRLASLNGHIQVLPITQALLGETLQQRIAGVDLVLDCSDNLNTRYQVNQACVHQQKPLISGAASGWHGQLMTFDFSQSKDACYQCLFPRDSAENPDEGLSVGSCRTLGIMGPVVSTLGTLQALQGIKLILGLDAEASSSRPYRHGSMASARPSSLRRFNGLTLAWQTLAIAKDPGCPVCKPAAPGQGQKPLGEDKFVC